jgi:hypothetical protein
MREPSKEHFVKKHIAVCSLFCALLLAACSINVEQAPTPVPLATFSALPAPTATHTPASASETPVMAAEWGGIPIMPGAVAGEGDEESYVFKIRATPQQIWEYYELELGKLGWKASVQDIGENYLTLVFTNTASRTLTMSIIVKGEDALVLMVR